MLIPERKESESIDKINSEIINNQEINYVSKDENNYYYINNRRKNKKRRK